ncbi:MAG: TIGR03960 family B12-binding radical SAM protein [bacterium]
MGWRVSQGLMHQLIEEVTKPGRYIRNFLNFPTKVEGKIGFLICFPDLFEIGMSNLGIRILYHVLSRHPLILADLAFAPWIDMEAFMRARRIPLTGLATGRNANRFDVVGFSLQHELQYTNVLTMLDLSGIPLISVERSNDDPIVIAGGPCASNPEPMAEFIDGFVIGDGEKTSVEIAEVVGESRSQGKRRAEILDRLAQVEGFYVPRHGSQKVSRRIEPTLRKEDYPIPPIVSVFPVTHDRLTIEIMRGCTRGCRFCSAGMVSRPARIRSIQDVIDLTLQGIDLSGWDEVSMISLSSSDYPCVDLLVRELASVLQDKNVRISLPSLRPGTFNREMAELISKTRRSGLTFAPEAGSEKLRKLINKPVDDEDLFSSVEIAYRAGWDSVKLYFMVGLPEETAEDVSSIVKLVRAVESIARGYGKRKELTVSISPFVPRPHTPLQWEQDNDPADILERIRLIKKGIGDNRVKVKWRDPYMAYLESLIARGDGNMGKAIFYAWQRGSRFESWSDRFDFSIWRDAFIYSGIDLDSMNRHKGFDDQLPWDHIDVGVTKEFLVEEARRAKEYRITQDCRTGECSKCGACQDQRPFEIKNQTAISVRPQSTRPERGDREIIRLRVRYQKDGAMLLSSHLDVVRCIHRALRRSHMPIVFSQGFNPHPKVAFGPPLPLGVASQCEYFDVYLQEKPAEDWIDRLNRCLPEGLKLLDGSVVHNDAQSLVDMIAVIKYRCEVIEDGDPDWEGRLAQARKFFEQSRCIMELHETRHPGKTVFEILGTLRRGEITPEKVFRNALRISNLMGSIMRVEVLWKK